MYNYGEYNIITVLKGIIGAVIGALPGIAIWILLGKIGVISSAVGLLVIFGIVLGCHFMTKNNELPEKFSIVICIAVFLIAMIISEKIIWTWELAESFSNYLPTFRDEIISEVMAKNTELSKTDVEKVLTDELYNEIVMDTFGIKEGTFSECFSEFSVLLEKLNVKSRYTASLLQSILFGAVGLAGIYARNLKSN